MIAVARQIGLITLLAWLALPAWVSAAVWQDLNHPLDAAARGQTAAAVYYRALQADRAMLSQALAAAPLERTASQGALLELPMPNGENQQFEVELSPILSPALAARYPDITTYRVTGIDDPAVSGRLDMSPAGFHAMLSTPAGTVFIDPDTDGNYRSYYKRDYAAVYKDAASQYVCHLDELPQPALAPVAPENLLAARSVSTNSRRVYRLAVVATGEYGAYFGSEAAATNHIVTTINRVNQIYGRDLAVQLQLVEAIVYTNASSDPFPDPADQIGMLSINQDLLDFAVGLDNYDIGHLFGISGGGIALLGSACTAYRAQGYTGHPTPDIGDPFDIDFVAHELGHQLSATHTFNGSAGSCYGNRTAATAVEPGSGTTIMAYAGICGDEDLQSNSDATFHASSIGQINAFINNGSTGGSCGSSDSTSNGLPVTINAGADVSIPKQTPFVLTGTASSDPDGDTLSYQWDEIDAGVTATTAPAGANPIGADHGDNPLFRSFVPKATATRYFPRLSSLIAGTTDIGETLPTTSRTLHFRMTVRDGNSGVGDDDVNVTVLTSGPFQIDGGTLNSNSTLTGGTTQTLNWNVNSTATGCPKVSISLLSISSDGTTYCDKDDDARLALQSDIDNSGISTTVPLPSVQIARSRVMLSCDTSTSPFFAISDVDLQVVSAANPIASDCKTMDGAPLEHGTVFVSPDVGGGSGLFGGGGGGGALFLLPLMLAIGGLLRRLSGRPASDSA